MFSIFYRKKFQPLQMMRLPSQLTSLNLLKWLLWSIQYKSASILEKAAASFKKNVKIAIKSCHFTRKICNILYSWVLQSCPKTEVQEVPQKKFLAGTKNTKKLRSNRSRKMEEGNNSRNSPPTSTDSVFSVRIMEEVRHFKNAGFVFVHPYKKSDLVL